MPHVQTKLKQDKSELQKAAGQHAALPNKIREYTDL
jgi:hypothetical protein